MVVHEDNDNTSDTLINRIKCCLWKQGEYDPDSEQSFVPALCNRIDRNTGGIVIAAKTAEALRSAIKKARGKHRTALEKATEADLSQLDSGLMPEAMDKYYGIRYPAPATLLDHLDAPLFILDEVGGIRDAQKATEFRRSEELTAQAAKKIEELASYAAHRDALQLGADTLSTRIAREETAEKLLQSDSTFYFEGWLTAPEEKKLGETLSKYCCAWETEGPDPEHPEEVPIQLRNNALTRPYNIVTEMYSCLLYTSDAADE